MQKALFVGYSYDKIGPYFLLEDLISQKRQKLYFDSVLMTIENTNLRYCIGTYDLETFSTRACRNRSIIPNSQKDNRCERCQREIGFNPAFYHAGSISPQQAKYNLTPHLVYMAYFSPNHIKVGIASERRHSIRLLEQGARAAIILKKFPNADSARQLEASLCSNHEILETLTSEKKLRLLNDEHFVFENAETILIDAARKYFHSSTASGVINLEPYYFYKKTFNGRILRIENQKDAQISGRLVGMIGDLVILAPSGFLENEYVALSAKKYISHVVRIYQGESRYAYSLEPIQYSLWDTELLN